MTKRKIHKLSFDLESDFNLIGIASHENDYRLSWAINKKLNLDLVKIDDVIITHPKHKIEINYSTYHFEDENNLLEYHLISNKSEKGFLIPGMKNIDFVLRVSGNPELDIIHQILSDLKKVDIIITAFHMEDLPDRIHKMLHL